VKNTSDQSPGLKLLDHDSFIRKGFARLRAGMLLGILGGCCLTPLAAEEKAAEKSAPTAEAEAPADGAEDKAADFAERMRAIFPGITIKAEERCVDVDATICLSEGFLELVACTKDTKEHESILVIDAKAQHVHAALLLLGAKPGNPAMRKPINEEATRWVHIPPQGNPVKVSLVYAGADGAMVERPISDFITPSEDESVFQPNEDEKKAVFPDAFVFAGSFFHGAKDNPQRYLADDSGNVISVSTFGDELLCLSGIHAQDNAALSWQINTENIPELGTKVKLRLRPELKEAPPRE
jgi:hypothetical protein